MLSAPSGFEALALAQKHRPNAILPDVMMPDLDGPDTFSKLQAEEITAPSP